MYIVIKPFHDLQDFSTTKDGRLYHYYDIGDEFPRTGKKVSAARIQELSSTENAQKQPLIKKMEITPAPAPAPNESGKKTGRKGRKRKGADQDEQTG